MGVEYVWLNTNGRLTNVALYVCQNILWQHITYNLRNRRPAPTRPNVSYAVGHNYIGSSFFY